MAEKTSGSYFVHQFVLFCSKLDHFQSIFAILDHFGTVESEFHDLLVINYLVTQHNLARTFVPTAIQASRKSEPGLFTHIIDETSEPRFLTALITLKVERS